jgi:hypothetical protein
MRLKERLFAREENSLANAFSKQAVIGAKLLL